MGLKDVIHSRKMICNIISTLYNAGWILSSSTGVSVKKNDKDTLIFRYQLDRPSPCSWFTISFNEDCKLQLIGAPEELIAPIRNILGPLLKEEKRKELGTYQFKCHGSPWEPTGAQLVTTRLLLLALLEVLELHRFRLYAAFDPTITSNSMNGADIWVCCRPA